MSLFINLQRSYFIVLVRESQGCNKSMFFSAADDTKKTTDWRKDLT